MKIKSKILYIVIVIFAFFITVSLIFNVWSLVSRAENEIQSYEKRAREKVKNNLKNYVQIAYSVVKTNYDNATQSDKLERFYSKRLNNYIDIIEEIIDDKKQKVKEGRLSIKDAKKQTLDFINDLRYNNESGYFWVMNNDINNPTMILEPILPGLNGKSLLQKRFNDSNGGNKNLFVNCIEECNDSTGDGYLAYSWPKKTTSSSDSTTYQQKYSYVRQIKDWDWIVGTGIYLDETIKDAATKSISDLRTIRYYDGSGYFWINNDEKPTPRLIMNPFAPALEGKILTDKKYNRAFGKDINLYEAFLAESEKGDGGFVWYKWDKPKSNNETKYDVLKESYVKYFRNLGWVIGSGLYTDDIDAEIVKRTNEMEKVRTRTIIMYLIISVIFAGLSIVVLIIMMNKHFKKNGINEEGSSSRKSKKENTMLTKFEKDITPHVNAVNKNKKEEIKETLPQQTTIDDASNLIKTFMNEQTKLIAFNNILKNSEENQTDEIKELAVEIKKMASALTQNSNDIKLIINKIRDEQGGNR